MLELIHHLLGLRNHFLAIGDTIVGPGRHNASGSQPLAGLDLSVGCHFIVQVISKPFRSSVLRKLVETIGQCVHIPSFMVAARIPLDSDPLDHKHQPDENDEVAVRNSSDISEGEMNLNIFALGALDTL